MNTAFESIKAGLQQAIAHQQNKPAEVVVHEPAAQSDEATSSDIQQRETTPK